MTLWDSLYKKLGVTRSELFLILIMLSGLIIGLIYKEFKTSEKIETVEYIELYAMLDSIAEVQKTSYTSTDSEGTEIEELEKADTVIIEKSLYSQQKKKGLPNEGELININTANIDDLIRLPGVGEKTAEKIIKYRKVNTFESIYDIMNIKGIGQKKFDNMKKYLAI